ncbi:MAG: flagellar filament capping protein FliD, partial [Syntrophaceticus sp.]
SYQVKVSQLATVATNSSTGRISAAAALTGDAISNNVEITESNNKFNISLDGETVEIVLQQQTYDDLNDLVNDIQSEIDASSLQGKVVVSLTTENQIRFAVAQENGNIPTIKIGGTSEALGALGVLGFEDGQSSVKVDPIDSRASLWSQKDKFLSGNFAWTEDHTFSFTIKVDNQSHTINVNGDTETFDSLIARINKECGVSLFYDPSVDKVSFATNKTGNRQEGAEIQINGAFLTDVLQISEGNEKGGIDASFEINGLSGLTSHDNTYTVNGVTFYFKGADPNKAVTVSLEQDIDRIVDVIKDFVETYNEILESVNKKLYEQRFPSYSPLTEEQIRDGGLTDRQIDAWEEKARSGLLKGDTILSGALAEMRAALSSIVQGITDEVTVTKGFEEFTGPANQLSIIGITTGHYQERGKLHLDEKMLRDALESNADAVVNLFTRATDADGNEITDPAQKGIAVRLYDSINNAMSRITRQAGSAGSLYDDSYISRTVRQIDERMARMEEQYLRLEERYYRQFTYLEQAIAKLNTQSMWLTMQFMGGGQ